MSPPVLIIGAGVAGMTAAVELADSGVQVLLVEKNSSIGGNALDLYKAFPTDDCFYCFESNRWRPGIRKCFYRSALLDQPNIDLRVSSSIEEITRDSNKFSVKILSEPEYVDAKKCIMCGLCLEKSEAFSLATPQCQPQAVVFDKSRMDDGAAEAEEKCPTKAIDLSAEATNEMLQVSDIVLASGYHEMKPVNMDEYGYGTHPNIVTQLELAQIMDPIGETAGQLIRPSDGAPAKRVLMVQCVGSRDEDYYPYCSKICCTYALKHAIIAKEERNAERVTVVYIDIRSYDRHEDYYNSARDVGVDFIRGRITRVEPMDENTLKVTVYDSLLDRYLRFPVDLFVLSSAIAPSESPESFIKSLNLGLSSGFIAPSKSNPENKVVVGDRIYACGAAIGPGEIPESVTQARAVASIILQRRKQ